MLKRIFKNIIIGMSMLVITAIGILYIKDFRYNREVGIYKIVERGSDYTEEGRKEKRINENYEFRVICSSFEWFLELL